MQLTATMMLSVDGVYQDPGGPQADRRGDLPRFSSLPRLCLQIGNTASSPRPTKAPPPSF